MTLARAVPDGGEARIRIIKTYKDAKSYYKDGDAIVFDRSLGIKRNAVVLPRGYELTSCNIPAQILEETDGRVVVSFMNTYPGAAPLLVRGRPFASGRNASASSPSSSRDAAAPPAPAEAAAAETPMNRVTVAERAFQDREIVYFLNDPATHSFSLYHDYTETREGTDKYLNVVRRGSAVSKPSARNLDTGDALKVETLKGEAITKAALDIGEQVVADSEVVVIRFPAVKKGQSIRLRIEETYTDPARYARSRRAVDVAPQFRPSEERHRAACRLASDHELDSGDGVADQRRSRAAGICEPAARLDRRLRQGTQPLGHRRNTEEHRGNGITSQATEETQKKHSS